MRTPLSQLAAALVAMTPVTLLAQPNAAITPKETAARREAIAARIDSGVVIAFGGRALVHDFSTFYQLPAFRYLTELNEPDAAVVMVVRNKRPQSTLFLTPLDARTAFYYGVRALRNAFFGGQDGWLPMNWAVPTFWCAADWAYE